MPVAKFAPARKNYTVRALVSLIALLASIAFVTPAAEAADGPANIPNSAIADRAEAHVNGTPADQCLVFVTNMIKAAGGPQFYFGFDTSTYQAQWGQRATAIGSLAEAQRGDIVQWGGGAGGTLDPHTAILTRVGSDPQVIDSNYGGNVERVGRGSFASRNPAGSVYRIWRVGRSTAVGDVYFLKTKNTGTGRVEAFTTTQASRYHSGIASATRWSPADHGNGWFGMLPNNDAYFVKTKNTGSRRVEAFTLTKSSGFRDGVASPTRFSAAEADNGWFGLLPNTDLYYVKTKRTGSGRVEVHTVTRASGYTTGVSTTSRFSPADADNGWFGLLPNGDLYFIKTRNTGSGRVEAFTATAASGYRDGVASATRFSPADASNGWFRMSAHGDAYFVKTRNTGSGRVELHTATRSSGFRTGISTTTRFSPADANNGWFGLLD